MTLTDVMLASLLVWSAPPPPQPARMAAAAVLSSASFHVMDFIVYLFACLEDELKKERPFFSGHLKQW
jgi:hypothetical protein